MFSRRTFLAATALPLCPGAETATMLGDEGPGRKWWPRWRGPSGQGIADGAYPDRWDGARGENIAWSVELPGAGNSSPVVWAGRIFLTTAYGLGERRTLLCLRRSDGKLLWETAAAEAAAERANRKNGHASATPCTDGERVYGYLGNHGALAVDFEGRVVWHQSMGTLDAYHGTACSPLLYQNLLILYQDHRGSSGGFVVALDKRTGKEVWRTPRSERVGWGTPVAIRTGIRDEIIVSSYQRVYAYDPRNGSELWRCEGNLVEVIPTPVAGNGLLFCCSGRAGPTLAIRPGGSGDVTNTRIAWQTPKGSPFVPSPLLYDGHLYLVNDMTAVATCYEASTGKLMWQGRLGEARRESFSASLIGTGGKVYFTNDDGETFVVKAGAEFQLLNVNAMGDRTLASPALVEGRWYYRTAKHLVCVGAKG